MFLSIATEGPDSQDLSYLLQKHPGKVFTRDSSTLIFPVYEPNRANAVFFTVFPEYFLWNADTRDADCYVTSREYAISSLFWREAKHGLRNALAGTYKDPADQAKADKPRDWLIEILPIVTNVEIDKIKAMFRALGYTGVSGQDEPGQIGYSTMIVDHSTAYDWQPQKTKVLGLVLKTSKPKPLSEVLKHLLILTQVLDIYTHYTELDPLVEELKQYSEPWLDQHPMKDFIRARFLRFKNRLIKEFDGSEEKKTAGESELEEKINLQQHRINWFVDHIVKSGARSAVDAGCGAGRLAEALVEAKVFEVLAFDPAPKAIRVAMKFLKGKASAFESSLLYYDPRLAGKEVMALQEVIEHLSPWQFGKAVDMIFKHYRPGLVLMSTPNREYNVNFPMEEGKFRHSDHKFEWNTNEATAFAQKIKDTYGYDWALEYIGLEWTPKERYVTDKDTGTVALLEPPKVTTVGVAPTFGFVFKRPD